MTSHAVVTNPAWPAKDSPRERCHWLGPGALSAVELLALILGSGGPAGSALQVARGLLSRHGNLRALARAHPSELASVPGLGPARSAALSAAFELGRREESSVKPGLELIEGPDDAARLLRSLLGGLGQEGIAVLLLGARHQVLRLQMVALGSLNAAGVEPREIFRGAIGAGAAALVLAHNHPSGSPEPSRDDFRLTRRLAACGETLGVKLLDHLVLGDHSYVSLRERGAL